MLNKIFQNLEAFHVNNAFCIGGKNFTYADFSKMIGRVQNQLKKFPNEELIGLVTYDSIDTYAAIFAILFEGKGFVALNHKFPHDRNLDIIQQTNLKVVVASHKGEEAKKLDSDVSVIYANELDSKVNVQPEFNHNPITDIAYILFTSGSTGKPKGVTIARDSVDAFVESFNHYGFSIGPEDRFLQMFDLTFDVSIACTFLPLSIGACAYTIPTGVKYLSVYKTMQEHKITVATLVPSLLSYLKPYYKQLNFSDVKYCIFTAEASYDNAIKEWQPCVPNAEIWNFYGPTEATIWSLACQWFPDKPNATYNGMLGIGKPLLNVQSIIVDDEYNEVAPGKKGQLCLSGRQVTMGYWKNNEQNEKAFFEKNGIRYYKTGDLTYQDENGEVLYCGRIDNQVQIQGYRVELNEIEFITVENFKCSAAVAIASKNALDNMEINLFVEAYEGNEYEIKEFIKSRLPYYMVPEKIIALPKFPTNRSDKVDRKSLLKMITT